MPASLDRVVQGTAALHFVPDTRVERMRECNGLLMSLEFQIDYFGRPKFGMSVDDAVFTPGYYPGVVTMRG